jgi:hypothetical protein
MAINKNHEFEELDAVKCAIVERNATPQRVQFLKALLELNNYTVIVVPSPPAKTAGPAKSETDNPPVSEPALQPETFTVGVTDVMFNPTNAIFGRLLRTKDGHVVTLAYWLQKEEISHDEVPYFENRS